MVINYNTGEVISKGEKPSTEWILNTIFMPYAKMTFKKEQALRKGGSHG